MNRTQFALRNIQGSAFRSWAVALCAFVVAAFTLSLTIIARGAENSLHLAMDRLGSDILVVPRGNQVNLESALLMGSPTQMWMPAENLDLIRDIPGVAQASPQLYLITLHNASCCSVSDMFLIAFDPTTDFTIQPWIKKQFGEGLRMGEAIGGKYIYVPDGEQNIKIYGYFLTLKANLESTGTGLDQSMFITFETAQDIARISVDRAVSPLVIPQDSVSSVLIKVTPGANLHDVAVEIMKKVPNVTPIESSDMFQSYRRQMNGLLQGILVVLVISWGLAVILIGLIFSIAANDRQRELGVLRAMGATDTFVLQSLMIEVGILAMSGAVAGALFAALVIGLFHTLIVTTLGFPFLFPSPLALIGQVALGLLVAACSVLLAISIPAIRVSRLEPAEAMRE